MAIDDQPMNVYWSGKRTETINRSKINYKGSVATFSDLPDTNNQKGDMYSITGLNGENYIWDGTAWDSLGTSDAGVVHLTGAETISGSKTFSSDMTLNGRLVITGNIAEAADNDEIWVCGGSGGSNVKGAYLRLRGTSATGNSGMFFLCTGKVSNSYANLNGSPDGTLEWGGQPIQTSSDERLKTPMAAVPDAVLDAWGEVQWGQFQFLDAVQRKGGSARLHLGLIAQRVKAVFEVRGMDACQYGILCLSQDTDMWTVRYAEALAMEVAFQRRRADRAEARLAVLEERLSALEARYPE